MARETYSFKAGSRLGADKATKVGRELGKISKRHGGLTAEIVVGVAQKKGSPLHGFFEWSDTEAARQYRLEQARHLIRCVVVKYDAPENAEPVRAYVTFDAHPDEEDLGRDVRYLSTHEVLTDSSLRDRLVRQAWREFQLWRQRYEHLKELAHVFAAADNGSPKEGKGKRRKTA